MNIKELKCCSDNVNIDDYLKLYKDVRDNMKHPEWLGTFSKEEIEDILANKGKIWLYYNDNEIVCSMFYIPENIKTLKKHNIEYNKVEVGSLGPIMVNPNYIGNSLQIQMMNVLDEYCKSINKKYIFTKVCSNNIFSINNLLKYNYTLIDTYINERGENSVFIKEI